MCISNTSQCMSTTTLHFPRQKPRSNRFRVRVRIQRLSRMNKSDMEEEEKMEMKNLKLYMENMNILKENEKLRKKASLLHQENLALMSEFQKKFSSLYFDRLSTTLFLLDLHT